MSKGPILSATRARSADAAALDWWRRATGRAEAEAPRPMDTGPTRDAYRLACDAWRAWAMEYPHMDPAAWHAPYSVWASGKPFPHEEWAAPLCINAACKLLKTLEAPA